MSYPAWCGDVDQSPRVPKAKQVPAVTSERTRITVAPAQAAPKQRTKVRGGAMSLGAWIELGRMVQAAKKLDEPIRGKGKRPIVGTYTRKDAGKCKLVQRHR